MASRSDENGWGGIVRFAPVPDEGEGRMDRFQVFTVDKAKEANLPEAEEFSSDYRNLLYDFLTEPPKFVACDGGEPEDHSFYRDLSWVVRLLNDINRGD